MNYESIPIVQASSLISDNNTVFQTLDSEVVVDVPGSVIAELIRLCDGTRTFKEVLENLPNETDEETVNNFEALINKLHNEGVIINAKNVVPSFWKMTQNPSSYSVEPSDDEIKSILIESTKRHRGLVSNKPYYPDDEDILSLLKNRESTRNFSGEKVAFQKIINMLWSAYGERFTDNEHPRRTVPSAGAMYPLRIHLILLEENSYLSSGIYEVSYGKSCSIGFNLISKDYLKVLRSFADPMSVQKGVHGIIVISGSFSFSSSKYGNRSMLFVPLEAGHVAQNIHLVATDQEIATLEVGSFMDELLSDSLNLPDDYQPLTTVAFGKKGAGKLLSDKLSRFEIDWAIPKVGNYQTEFSIASARLSDDRSWSHGRDSSPDMALRKAISEAKEWTACGCIPRLKKSRYVDLEKVIDPESIICFHPDQYKLQDFPFKPFDRNKEYEWIKGIDTRNQEYYILADCVYFPYYPETPYHCYANSSGCAAHPDKQTAIQSATLELIERDSFMNSYLSKLEMPIVAQNTLPDSIQNRISNLESSGFDVWIVDHSLDLAPVVFVLAQNKKLNFTTCASSASFDIEHAVSHALMEVEASVLYRLHNGVPDSIIPSEVVWPSDHGKLYGQEKYFHHADFMIKSEQQKPFNDIGDKVAKNWNELLDRFQTKGWKHLIIPLELSEDYGGNEDLHIVRSIVPEMVPLTFGYQQEPAGMKRIYEIAKRYGGKELLFNQLTKFPHPFE